MCEIPEPRTPGMYPIEPLPPGWENVWVTIRNTRRVEMLEVASSTLYPQEPLNLIALKCLGLFLVVTPLYYLSYFTVHLIRLSLVPLVNGSATAFFREFWKIVQIPFLWIGQQFAALYGVWDPLRGRALFGKLESLLHDGKTRREAEQHQKAVKSGADLLWEACCVEEPKTALFLGFCMQPYGRTDDPAVTRWELIPA